MAVRYNLLENLGHPYFSVSLDCVLVVVQWLVGPTVGASPNELWLYMFGVGYRPKAGQGSLMQSTHYLKHR
jgi:hypothetical protein